MCIYNRERERWQRGRAKDDTAQDRADWELVERTDDELRGRALRDIETRRGGQTTQKANMYLGDCWTSQPEQV